MNINSSVAIKAGLIGAAVGFIIAVLGRIPFLGCIINPLFWLVAAGAGVLYVYLAASGGSVVQIAEGIVGGAVAGGIAGLAHALVRDVLRLIFGSVGAASRLLSGAAGQGLAMEAGFGIVAAIIGIIGGTVFGAILGALGGLVFAAIKGQSK